MAKPPPIAAKISGFSEVFDVYEVPGATPPLAVYFHEEGDAIPPHARLLHSGLSAADFMSAGFEHAPQIEAAATRIFPGEDPAYASYLLLGEVYAHADQRRNCESIFDTSRRVSRLDTLEQIHAIQESVVHAGARHLMDTMLSYPSLQIRALPEPIVMTNKHGHERKFGGVSWHGIKKNDMHLVELYEGALAKKDAISTWIVMEELAHKAIEIVFGNSAKPYTPDDTYSKRQFFHDVRDDLKDWRETPMPQHRQRMFPSISSELRHDLGLGDPSNPRADYSYSEYNAEIPAKVIAMKAAGLWDREMQWKYPRIGKRIDGLIDELTTEMRSYIEMSGSLKAIAESMDLDTLRKGHSGPHNRKNL